jgi:uncharacterized membrane protein (DUF4010 family)
MELAAQAIVVATLANTIVKTGMVATLASAGLRKPILLAAAGILAAGGVTIALA